MKSMSIAKQLACITLAMVLAGVISVVGFGIQLRRTTAHARDLTARASANNASMLALVESVTKLQGVMQQVLRERDPNALKGLVSQIEALEKSSQASISASAIHQAALSAGLKSLTEQNRGVLQTLLLGEYATAQGSYIEKAAPASQLLMAELNQASKQQQQVTQRELDESTRSSQTAQTLILLLVVAALAGSSALAWFVVRRVNSSLTRAADELSRSAEQITNASAQVSRASQALAQGANEQVTALEQTSASSEEINTTSEQNASNTQVASELMSETADAVAEAGRKMDGMVTSVKAIGSSSEKISRIIKVIDDIAFQTNILALNAAVEAARAGEAGMGFAVVADEVRNLAQRCAQAAKDTTELIEESIARSKEGSGSVQTMAASLSLITEKTVRAKELVETVSRANQNQARGTREITRSISHIEQVTQQAAANAQENAASGEELSAQAESLRDVIAGLEALVGSHR